MGREDATVAYVPEPEYVTIPENLPLNIEGHTIVK
jgi:hypothetical protein